MDVLKRPHAVHAVIVNEVWGWCAVIAQGITTFCSENFSLTAVEEVIGDWLMTAGLAF